MKKYKLNEIYVLRPMKLQKVPKYTKVKFPYNLTCLFNINCDAYLKILEKSGKTTPRYVFKTTDDVILATKDNQSQYTNLLNGEVYFPHSIDDINKDNLNEEMIFTEYISTLEAIKCEKARKEFFGNSDLDSALDMVEYSSRYLALVAEFNTIKAKIMDLELTLEELETIQSELKDLDSAQIKITLGEKTKVKEKIKRK